MADRSAKWDDFRKRRICTDSAGGYGAVDRERGAAAELDAMSRRAGGRVSGGVVCGVGLLDGEVAADSMPAVPRVFFGDEGDQPDVPGGTVCEVRDSKTCKLMS